MYQYKREPLNDLEVARLRGSTSSARDKLIVELFLETGVRLSELAELKPDQIDWQLQRLTIYGKAVGRNQQHNSKRRVLPLSMPALQALASAQGYITERRGSVWLSPRQIERRITALANKAGITRKTSPHVLRHTFAVTCLRKGIHPVIVQHLLGHERFSTTQSYLNLSPEDVINEYRKKW